MFSRLLGMPCSLTCRGPARLGAAGWAGVGRAARGGALHPVGPTGATTSCVHERGHSDFLPCAFNCKVHIIDRCDRPERGWVGRGIDRPPPSAAPSFHLPRGLCPRPAPTPTSCLWVCDHRDLMEAEPCRSVPLSWPFAERDPRRLSRAVAGAGGRCGAVRPFLWQNNPSQKGHLAFPFIHQETLGCFPFGAPVRGAAVNVCAVPARAGTRVRPGATQHPPLRAAAAPRAPLASAPVPVSWSVPDPGTAFLLLLSPSCPLHREAHRGGSDPLGPCALPPPGSAVPPADPSLALPRDPE